MNALPLADLNLELPEIFSTPYIDFVVIEGRKISDKNSLFKEFSEKLNFPDYFGFNWDAFSDCLTDLSWLEHKNSFFIIYKETRQFRLANPEDWRIAQDILLETVDYWREQGKSVTIIYL
jgi:RNAse (barnase) inhibitor barstar